jgi:hypothetical protein
MPGKTLWPPERLERLRKLFIDQRMSASACAESMGNGLTRSAVLGVVDRQGWERPKDIREPWPEERVERLRVLYIEKGMSAGACAKEMGDVSRSAVIGIAVRRGWARSQEVTSQNNRRAGQIGQGTRAAALKPIVRANWGVFEQPSATARPWITRVFGECAFPVGGEGADTLSCCAGTGGESYCAHHRQVMRASRVGVTEKAMVRDAEWWIARAQPDPDAWLAKKSGTLKPSAAAFQGKAA